MTRVRFWSILRLPIKSKILMIWKISPFILSNLGTFPYWVKLEYIFHQFLVLPFFEFLFANWFFLHVSLILPLYKHLVNICRHVAKIAFAFGIFRIPFRVHSIDLIWQGCPWNITGNIWSHWKTTGHPGLNLCAQNKSETEIKKWYVLIWYC